MKKSRGFTLIELMIVVAIVILLIAIISPMFRGKRDAKQENNVKPIETPIHVVPPTNQNK